MVGFEDSVNMAEETQDPTRTFPKMMLTGLGIAAFIYVLVSIVAVALVPVGTLADSETPLLEVVRTGAPGLPIDQIFPFISMFAVANTALINMLMASRLIYGMAKQDVLPRSLASVLPGRRTPWASIVFVTLVAFGLIFVVTQVMGEDTVEALGGTTALLLLGVFTAGQRLLPGAAPGPPRGPRPLQGPDGDPRRSAPSPARSWSARGPTATRCSTRSAAGCCCSAWCCGC